MKNGGKITRYEETILISFVQQEIRSLEQAISTYVKPAFYTGKPITTSHNSWLPNKE